MDALTRGPVEVAARGRSRSWVMVVLCLLVLAAIGGDDLVLAGRPGSTRRPRNNKPAQPIPVLVAAAAQRDVPIWLDGLGTVQAFYTVTIHTMVDGPLVAVDFKEGQDVRKGDVLAQVDPRTYQAALDQVTAKKAQDEALLANARVDLARYQKLVATNYTTAQQADTQKSLVAQLEAQVRQDQAQIDTARTQLELLHDRLADRWADRHPAGRSGQYRARGRCHRAGGDHPVAADLGAVHAAAAVAAGGGGRDAPGDRDRCWPMRRAPAGSRGQSLDTGVLTVLDNQVDPTTGTIKLKATFPNGTAGCGRAGSSACGCRWTPRMMRSWCRRRRSSAARAAPTCSSRRVGR